jgi:hypothetical protein
VTPWSLFEGTHVINPAYDFLPSVLFFIGFFECVPVFTTGWLSAPWAAAWMGFSLFWIMQFHFSWVYLVPLTFLALGISFAKGKSWKVPLGFLLGALPTLGLVAPTWLKFGLQAGHAPSGFLVSFNFSNVLEAATEMARYLSLVCFELLRFIGQNTQERWGFLVAHPLLLVPGVILSLGGILQPILLLLAVLKKKHALGDWEAMKGLMVACYLMIWVSFWFTSKLPLAHIYMVFYPMLMVYSFYVLDLFPKSKVFSLTAKVFVLLGFFFMTFYAPILGQKDGLSLNREPLAQALQHKDYHLAGERRPGTLY